MSFDLFLEGPPTADAVPRIRVTLRCPACRRHSMADIWNRRWNALACTHCRHIAKQYTNACAATIDPVTRHIGYIAITQIQPDWRPYGLMAMCLGFDRERRILLYLQLATSGLKGQAVRVRCVARTPEDTAIVWTLDAAHVLCRCGVVACKHNRLVRWLPPTNVWNHDHLVGEFRVYNSRGEVYFEDKLQLNIAPPMLGQSSAQREAADRQLAEATHE